MAKTSVVARNERRKKKCKNQDKRNKLRKILKSITATTEEKQLAMLQMAKMPRDTSPVRVCNRCRITGKANGNYRKFELGRTKLREYFNEGLIPGLQKASW